MKRKATKQSRKNKLLIGQRGSIRNFISNFSKKRLLIFFIVPFVAVGSYFIIISSAAEPPLFWGNVDYWAPRIRACSSLEHTYGNSDYTANYEAAAGLRNPASGAYSYTEKNWNNYKGYSEAYLAPPEIQDERFAQDWNNSKMGSSPWKDKDFCWRPGGTIASAPCLPVPKNPLVTQVTETESQQTPLSPANTNQQQNTPNDEDEDE